MKQQTADAIKQYFSDHYEEFLSDFMKLLRAESPSNNKAAGEACAKVLSEIVWDRLAVKPLVYEQEDYAPHLRFTVGSGKRRVLLMGHYDTVWDVGSKPISCENGIVRGPGCFDMKCGLISAIWSLKAAADLHGQQRRHSATLAKARGQGHDSVINKDNDYTDTKSDGGAGSLLLGA